MAEKTRQASQTSNLNDYYSYSENDLQIALDEFLEEEKKKEFKPKLWNFRTFSGFALIFFALTFLIQGLGLHIGPNLTGIMGALPIIGGIIVTFVGLGLFSRDRKRRRKERHKKRRQERHLYNSLNEKDRFSFGEKKTTSSGSYSGTNIKVDSYALRQRKKMFKSRRDKRVFGVCGGLAKYFGVSSTFVRLMFVVGTLLGYGFPILLYLALAIVLPKEPISLADFE